MAQAGLAKRIKDEAKAARSDLYQWVWDNHVEIAKAIHVRGSWNALRKAAIEAGIKITRQGPGGLGTVDDPTVAALRSAWRRFEANKRPPTAPVQRRKPDAPASRATPPTMVTPPSAAKPTTSDDIRARLSPGRKMPDPL